jgi:uncharacterized protein (DUF4415 family)
MKKMSMNRATKPVVDHENPEWARKDFERALPFSGLPPELRRTLSGRTRGSQRTPKKVPVSIRLSPDVLEAFRSTGAGWQARVDEILRAHIK